ncbi:MAG: PAS domain S-box protein [Xanthobacteraceae bacterium]|nr:PAS domain S-box protein [Xanthobacteraceae bacterium]
MTLSSRLALAMVLLVVVTTAVLSSFTYYFVTEAAIPRALDRLATKAALGALGLEAALNGARQDALMIQGGVAASGLGAAPTDVATAQPDAGIRDAIAARFSAIMRAKSDYDRLRVIGSDDGGRELVRVDRAGPDNATRVVPAGELVQQGEQDYFKRTIALPRSDTYVSPVMPGREKGPDRAASPMFHVAMPVSTAAGKVFGICVIDFDLGARFDRIRAGSTSESLAFVVNAAGDYLLQPDHWPTRGSSAPTRARVQADFPSFDAALADRGSGSGIWTDRDGTRYGIGWQVVRIAGGPGITVLAAARYSTLLPGLITVSSAALAGGAVAVLLAIVVAWGIARSLSRPLHQITRAAEALSRGELVEMPSTGGREIAVLAAAFAGMSTQLKAKQSLLENTVESIGDTVLVVDASAKIVIANAAAKRLLRIDPGAGRTTVSRKLGFFYPDGVTPMPASSSAMSRALGGEDIDDLQFVVETEQPCARAYISATARPLRDEGGAVCGAVIVYRDVTEQKRAYQALIDSEQVAQSIIDSALDAFVQTDENCVILDWSPHAEALMGWTRAEAIGASVDELVFPPSQRALHRRWVDQFLSEANGDTRGGRYESPLLHKNGREFFAEVSLTALRRGDRFIINAFVRDITDKRAAEEQLFQAQKMESVGQLTGGIAHDFNNMLTVITGTIEILAEGVKDNPALTAIAKMIDDAADRAAQLTANLLAFARKQPLRPLETDVNALVEEVVQLLLPTLGRQVEIETSFGDLGWPALVDRSQLSSALVNLAINARDAMPDGGKLALRTNNVSLDAHEAAASGLSPGDYVVIEVADTGAGIPAAIRDRIFEPFFSTKQFGTGSGLGLSMVFGFAKQSGGNILVFSEEGRGATFRIYLPKADTDTGPSQTAPVSDEEPRGGNETILCVEDDSFVRELVTTRLKSLGYKVIAASNAAEALDLVNAGTPFDLLFTDIIMPGSMNGRQLAEKVGELRRPLRVVFTSGNTFGAFSSEERPREGGLLLTKPYRKADLARMVRLGLDRPIDHVGDPIPTPYSVLPDVERFLRENPPKG